MSSEAGVQTDTAPGSSVRRRDTVLATLEIFRGLDVGITTNNIVTFLYLRTRQLDKEVRLVRREVTAGTI